MKYFKIFEFDSPDVPGSGSNMDKEFLEKLDKSREIAEIAYRINSGYRTLEHHEEIYRQLGKPPTNSAHLRGLAADIATPTNQSRFKILNALFKVGFNRIGIGKNFIHVDDDKSLPHGTTWLY